MNKEVYDKILQTISKAGGYIRTKNLSAEGISSSQIAASLKYGEIEKVSTGLYRLTDVEPSDLCENTEVPISFIDISMALSSGIICLTSALEFYGLTTYNPPEVTVAVPKNIGKLPNLIILPVQFYYWKENYYLSGIDKIKTRVGDVRIYDIHKTVCDVFRYRDRIGEDIFLESLKNYFNTKKVNLSELFKYSKNFTKGDQIAFSTIVQTILG